MSNITKLEQLLKEDVLVEVNDTIKELKQQLQGKQKKAIQEELNYMLEVKKYFDEVIEDIKLNNLTEDQAIDILEGLEDMKVENQEV